jgi:hypothetical protein
VRAQSPGQRQRRHKAQERGQDGQRVGTGNLCQGQRAHHRSFSVASPSVKSIRVDIAMPVVYDESVSLCKKEPRNGTRAFCPTLSQLFGV